MPASESSKSSNDAHQCDSCFKTYQRRDLLLRHRRRCLRSNKPKIRRKACNACVLAKTKCCCTQPTCSRCAKRGISCEYVSAANTTAAIPSDSSDSSSSPSTRDRPRPDETRVNMNTPDFPSLWSPRSMLGGPDANSFDSWSSQNFIWTMDTLDFPSLPSSAGLVDQVTLDPTPAVPTSHPSFTLPLAPAPSQPCSTPVEISMVPPDPGIPNTSTLTGLGGSPDVLRVRPSNYVRLLAQYPRLLLQDDFNCPFIHRTLFTEQVADMTILPHTSMAICCGSALGSRDAAGYVKRAMDAQRQSLIESYPTYHCMEQWDALHAMLLYEILEMGIPPVDESESWKRRRRTKGLKSPFLSKMTQCFSRFYLESHDTALLPAADANSTNSWVKWAVAETARRTIFLANIVNFLNNRDLNSGRQSPYYEPLNDELIMKMPLPCDQRLWSARTEDEWRKSSPATPGSPGISDAFSTLGPTGDIPGGQQLPNGQFQPSLEVLFSKFAKDDLRANCATNAGFADSNELRSFIILCALEQFA